MYKLTISTVDLSKPPAERRTERVIGFHSSRDAWTAAESLTEPDAYGKGYMSAMGDTRSCGSVYADAGLSVMATVTREGGN